MMAVMFVIGAFAAGVLSSSLVKAGVMKLVDMAKAKMGL